MDERNERFDSWEGDFTEKDLQLAEQLAQAYDSVELDEDAASAMLGRLLAAESQARGGAQEMAEQKSVQVEESKPNALEANGAIEAEAVSSTGAGASDERAMDRRRRLRVKPGWLALVPLAAALVAVVVFAVRPGAENFAKNDAGLEATAELSETTEYEYSDEAVAAAANGFGGAAEVGADWPEAEFNTEQYDYLEESGFVSTFSQPLSTVSADVDTASYANLRRMLRDGWTADEIPEGAVRIEEMLNYFTYDYPEPEDGEDFSITARIGDTPWNADTKLLTLGFATAPEGAGVRERGANLVFLVDVSGSMNAENKLELLKDSFHGLLEQLGERDTVSIVTYASGEELVLDGASGNQASRIQRAIDQLYASGSTNGERGLELAYEVAAEHFIDGGVNRIIMASDGDLNVGISSVSDLHEYVEGKRETGIYLSVLGFGAGNYHDTNMETLADAGNGSYHYIDCAEEAERVFGENLLANLVPFADDVKVQVEFNPAQVKGYRLIGYENRTLAAEDFLDDAKDAGDVGPNAQFTVCYEIVPASSNMEIAVPELRYQEQGAYEGTASDDWLTAAIRYRAFADGEVHELEQAVGEESMGGEASADWHFQAAVIEFGMLLRGSDYAGTSSYEEAYSLAEGNFGKKSARSGKETLLELIELAEENGYR